MRSSRSTRLVPLALAGLLLAGAAGACGGGDDAPSSTGARPAMTTTPTTTAAAPATASAPAAVTLKDISFTPSRVTIDRGGSVRWTWKDGDTPHDVTFEDRHSATKKSGTYALKFATAGTYRYQCTIHPGMEGTVVVK